MVSFNVLGGEYYGQIVKVESRYFKLNLKLKFKKGVGFLEMGYFFKCLGRESQEDFVVIF